MPDYIRPSHRYETIGFDLDTSGETVTYLQRRVVKDIDTASDQAYMAENHLGERAFADVVVDEPITHIKYPAWPEWDIPADKYPPPIHIWVDYPEPEPEPEPEDPDKPAEPDTPEEPSKPEVPDEYDYTIDTNG